MIYEGGTIIPHGAPPNWSLVYCQPVTNALPPDLTWTGEAKSSTPSSVAPAAAAESFFPGAFIEPDEPGPEEGDTTSVQGLEPGEVIAADNFNKLGDGMKVNPRQPGGEERKSGAPGGGKQGGKKDKARENAS